MKRLETERLLLRPFAPSDLIETHRLLYADPQVAPAWAGRTRTIDEIKDSFAKKVAQQEGDFGFLALVLKESNQLIGTVALQRYAPGEASVYMRFERAPAVQVGENPACVDVELTYALGSEYWGKGYASEACRALVAYGFQELGVQRIVNSVNSQNLHSIGLMRRLGFQLQANLHPGPFTNSGASGVIGVLENDRL